MHLNFQISEEFQPLKKDSEHSNENILTFNHYNFVASL